MSGILYTQEQYEQLIRDMRAPKMQDNSAVQVADVESDSNHESPSKDAAKKTNPRVRIHVHSKRRRLADPDAISFKAAIDGLVRGGLLADDSAKEIAAITFSQEKSEFEETVIDVWEIEEKPNAGDEIRIEKITEEMLK